MDFLSREHQNQFATSACLPSLISRKVVSVIHETSILNNAEDNVLRGLDTIELELVRLPRPIAVDLFHPD